MYGLQGTLVAKAGHRDEVAALMLRSASADEPMPGCHLYLVGAAIDDPDAICVTELWESAEAHRASLEIPAVRETIQQALPLLDLDRMSQSMFSLLGGHGLG